MSILLNFSTQAQEETKVAKVFKEMSVSYRFTSIYVKGDFNAVRNARHASFEPTETFYFKDRNMSQRTSVGAQDAFFYYTLTSDIAVNEKNNTMTFYAQQIKTCEEVAVFFYGDRLIIVDFLNGTRLICSKDKIDLVKWREKLTKFDKIKNK